MLVEYAGKDPGDIPYSMKLTDWEASRQSRSYQAYQYFRRGLDTIELAEKYQVKEPTVIRWITKERSKRLGLPNPEFAKP